MNRIRVLVAVSVAALALLQTASADQPGVPDLDRPTWLTPQLRQAVLQAGSSGYPIPPQAGISSIAFAGLRPGTWMISPNWCTLNFLFKDPSSGEFYIGTASHCVRIQRPIDVLNQDLGGFGQVTSEPVVAIISTSPGGSPIALAIGTAARATPSSEVGNDFAVIKIYPEVAQRYLSPSISTIGGPLSGSAFSSGAGQPLLMMGHGMVIGSGGTARPGVSSAPNASVPYGFGAVAPGIQGDSGAPVRTLSGAAVGALTHIGVSPKFVGSTAYGTLASMVTSSWGLELIGCPSMIPWQNLGCPPP